MHGNPGTQNKHRPNQGPKEPTKATFQDALDGNRRRAGIKPNPTKQPRVDAFAQEESPIDSSRGAAVFKVAYLLLRLSGTTVKTKIILLLSAVGMFLYVMAALSSSVSQSIAALEGTDDEAKTAARPKPSGSAKAYTPPAGEICDEAEEMRTMGTQWLAAAAYAPGIPMTVKNKSQQIAFMDLQGAMGGQRATTILIMPGEEIHFPMSGTGITGSISSGTKWCNRKIGWQDGKVVPIRPAVMATNDTRVIKAILYDRSNAVLGMKVFNERPGRPAPVEFN